MSLKGTDNVSLAKGFYYYYRYFLNGHISRNGSHLANFKELPW
ncbi:MAG: hypothetical protein HC896_08655 [Bacteroidales bacterium]|nr:hypothetical protein [Bacteroidales bacterium]